MAATGVTSEQYDQIFGGVKSQAEEKGTFLFFFNIRVYENVEPDPNDPDDDGQRDIHEGPFTIKIKMTEELEKYTNFKMYYVNDDFTLDSEALSFEVSEDGVYLVGILKHLSPYVLVGDEKTEEEASTPDSGSTTPTDPTDDNNNNEQGTNTNTDGTTPKTNDNIVLYIVLLGISTLGLSILPIRYFKNKKSNI